MRKGLFTLLLSSTALLSGCKSVKNENAIYSIMNYEKEVIELKAESVNLMISEKYSFVLLMYSEGCSSCIKAKENLTKVTKDLGFATFQIEMYDASIQYLSENHPNLFNANNSYPFIYVFNEGSVPYKSKLNDLKNATNMKKMIKSYSIETNITTMTQIDSYNKYKSNNSEYMLFTYDSSVSDEKEVYRNHLYPSAATSSKKLLIIDKMTAKSELISEIYKDYGLSGEDGFDLLSTTIDGQIKTTLRYGSESGSNINNFVTSYF